MVTYEQPSGTSSKAKVQPVITKQPQLLGQRTFLYDFYKGLEFNPRVWGVDVKMMLYSWGATLLQLNLLSMTAHHYKLTGGLNVALGSYVLMLTFFLLEYNYFEHVHLYTYDLFAEKIGGEIIQSVALAIPCSLIGIGAYALIPWIYPLYYLVLFIPRERDDHEMCKKKYGEDWDKYCSLVPWRMVPYLY
ncbi:hypothetical protein HDU96_004386, partial [Phlyctochytrium bullatum]